MQENCLPERSKKPLEAAQDAAQDAASAEPPRKKRQLALDIRLVELSSAEVRAVLPDKLCAELFTLAYVDMSKLPRTWDQVQTIDPRAPAWAKLRFQSVTSRDVATFGTAYKFSGVVTPGFDLTPGLLEAGALLAKAISGEERRLVRVHANLYPLDGRKVGQGRISFHQDAEDGQDLSLIVCLSMGPASLIKFRPVEESDCAARQLLATWPEAACLTAGTPFKLALGADSATIPVTVHVYAMTGRDFQTRLQHAVDVPAANKNKTKRLLRSKPAEVRALYTQLQSPTAQYTGVFRAAQHARVSWTFRYAVENEGAR